MYNASYNFLNIKQMFSESLHYNLFPGRIHIFEVMEEHEKKPKNKKVNLGGSYKFKIAKKYSKPKRKGDKFANRRKKK